MAEKKTLFQKILDREEPGEILYEDDLCVALRDINPRAPSHALIVPRKLTPLSTTSPSKTNPSSGTCSWWRRRLPPTKG